MRIRSFIIYQYICLHCIAVKSNKQDSIKFKKLLMEIIKGKQRKLFRQHVLEGMFLLLVILSGY